MTAAGARDWRWRLMTAGDLGQVLGLAAAIHPDYPEDAAVFAERLGLFPQGCLVLEIADALQGYLLSHPWTAAPPPALNTMIGALPAFPALYYLHDLALAPAARGSGAARAAVARTSAIAATAGFDRIGLVAVNGADGFWRRCGFEVASDPALLDAARRYDDGALYMTHAIGGGRENGAVAAVDMAAGQK